MKKIWIKVKLFFYYLMHGLHSADIIMTSQEKDSLDGNSIEQKKEVDSVYKDLLRGEVTEEVKELRHEMYYAERLSHQYEYKGNGNARKKNKIFSYIGSVEESDGYDIQLIQDNKEDATLFMNNDMEHPGFKERRDFTIKIDRDFIPTARVEEYASKIVVKRIDQEHVMLDLYTPLTPKEFDRRSRMFVNEIERIYEGNERSNVIDFNGLRFTTYNAYNADDLHEYEYDDIYFVNIVKFDGSYVLKFIANIVKDGIDIITEFYNENTDKKSQNHEMRKNAVINFDAALELQKKSEEAENVENIINKINENV